MEIGLCICRSGGTLEICKGFKRTSLHPLYYNVVPELVAGCKENGIKLNPFTINEEKEMEMVMRAG